MDHKKELIMTVDRLGRESYSSDDFLKKTAAAIQRQFPQFNWVGFYFLENDGKLHVGPYVGKPTPHTVIDVDRGICGAAVREGGTIVVDDVNSDPRYLSCSLETQSEIVVPIRVRGKVIGELDIDSDRLSAFGANEKEILEDIATVVSKHLDKNSARSEGGDT